MSYDLYVVPVQHHGTAIDLNETSDASGGLDVRDPAWGRRPG